MSKSKLLKAIEEKFSFLSTEEIETIHEILENNVDETNLEEELSKFESVLIREALSMVSDGTTKSDFMNDGFSEKAATLISAATCISSVSIGDKYKIF